MRTIVISGACLLLVASLASAQTPGGARHGGAAARKPVPAPALYRPVPMPYGSKQSAALGRQPDIVQPAAAPVPVVPANSTAVGAAPSTATNPLAAIPPSRPTRSCC
jgi:hypothetical protein